MNVLSKLRGLLSLKKHPGRSIKYDADGFRVYFDGACAATVRWEDVLEIVAFKQDQFSCDSICFGFRCDDSGAYQSVGEHEVNFDAFSRLVVVRFPGFRTDWYATVVQPPFVENWTVVWQAAPAKKT
jgi:hypothetical protein